MRITQRPQQQQPTPESDNPMMIALDTQAREHTPVLKRGHKDPVERRMRFADARTMQPLPDALARFAEMPADVRPQTVVWCGDMPGRRMIRADVEHAAACGWSYRNYRADLRAATFTRDGYTVDVRSSRGWFGSEADPEIIADAWEELTWLLRAGFGQWAYLWPSPTMTGQELLRGSLPFTSEYPTLPAPLLAWLLTNPPQGGRTELLTAPDGLNRDLSQLPELYNLDMRWAYASCLAQLPTGPAKHDTRKTWLELTVASVGYEASFYSFVALIPDNWQHIGLLPTREDDNDGAISYPCEPGRRFTGWATGAEIQRALLAGWRVASNERIYWPLSGRHDVTRQWRELLRAMRDRQMRMAAQGSATAALLARALRNIVVHTVGSWNRVTRIDEGFSRYGTEGQTMPAGALPLPVDGGWQWRRERVHLDEWVHPEWYATVVGRVRAKLAARALLLPPESIVALRTDGILTTCQPNTDGEAWKPGGWRVKWHLPYGMAAPRTDSDVRRILDAATEPADDGTDHMDDTETVDDGGGE